MPASKDARAGRQYTTCVEVALGSNQSPPERRYQAINDLELDLLSLKRKLDFNAAQLVDKIQAARRKLTIVLWREL
jgi:hypothetical protein